LFNNTADLQKQLTTLREYGSAEGVLKKLASDKDVSSHFKFRLAAGAKDLVVESGQILDARKIC
jgi:hypothetical protein